MGRKIKPSLYPWLFTMIFFEVERCSNWWFGVQSVASPFGNYDPSCEMLWYGRCEHQNLWQSLPKFFHAIVRARDSDPKLVPNFTNFFPWDPESMPLWHTDFCYFWTLYAFPVIKIPTRPTSLAAPCGWTVWIFFPFLELWMKTPKATQKWSW